MSHATYLVGDVFDRMAELDDASVDCVITSPPYWRKRRYTDSPDELGQEASPGEFLTNLLRLTDELWRVVKDSGTIWFVIGDTAAGSGGWGGDVTSGARAGGVRWKGTNGAGIVGTPRAKSVCWIPDLFGASLAYGRNLLTGDECRQWITRPPVTWCKPAPVPGEIHDKFREGTELIVWASKEPHYFFDLDAVRLPPKEDWGDRVVNSGAFRGHPRAREDQSRPDRAANPNGVPPLNWWVVNTSRGNGDHFATFPSDLIAPIVKAACPAGGMVLDPFAGTGTTLAVATGHGRNAIGIDLDERNADLARERIGGLFLTVDGPEAA